MMWNNRIVTHVAVDNKLTNNKTNVTLYKMHSSGINYIYY